MNTRTYNHIYRYIVLTIFCLSVYESNSQCNIEISAEVVQCSDINNTFNALITVTGTGIGPSFVLGGNGVTFGTFSYNSSPVEIGPFNNDGTIYNFAAIDNTTLTCFGETQILPYTDCEIDCEISISDVEFLLCDGLARYANIYIENSTNVGNTFDLSINQVPVGTFEYGQEFYTIGPLTGDCTTGIGVTVFDNFHNSCSDFYWQPGPWCCPDECVINDVIVNTFCENDEIAGIIVDFNYNGNSNEQFEIILDSIAVDTSWVYEFPDTFFYNFIGASPDSILQGFGVAHVAKPNCGFYNDYVITCENTPPCSFSNIILNPINCDGEGTYSLGLDFQVESATSAFFDVYGDNTYLGAYEYANLPIVINNFPHRDSEYDIIRINDNGNISCSEEIEFMGLDCFETPCNFSNYFVEAHECDDFGFFDMYVQFNVEGEGNQGFIIRGNGIVYDTFEYGLGWYTFGPLQGDCVTLLEFEVIDLQYPDCSISTVLDEPVCCEVSNDCVLSDLVFNDIDCNEDQMTFFYNFNYSGVTNDFYDLFIGDDLISSPAFADLTNSNYIEIPSNDTGIYQVTICENDNPACCVVSTFQGPICETADCQINGFFIEAQDCNDTGVFYIDLEFTIDNPVSSSFSVFGDGNNYGSFEYGESFYTVGPFEGDCQSIYELIVVDNDSQDCTSNYLFLGPICCTIEECEITDLQVTPIECDDSGDYWVTIDFNHLGASNDFFNVIINNEIVSFHALADLPIDLLYPASGNDNDVLMVCINDNPDCCSILEFPAIDCSIEIGDCAINDVFAEAHECDDNGFFLVDISFEYMDGSSQGFEIRGNGTSYGFFNYGEPFYTIGPIEGDCETLLEFIIIDLADESCTSFTGFEEPICCEEEGCHFSNLEVEIISCDINEQIFFASISFDINSPGSDFFSISGNGQDYGSFSYGQDSYTLGPLVADGNTEYEFIVTDLELEDCSTFVELGTVTCTMVNTDDLEFSPNIKAWFQDDLLIIDNPDALKITTVKIFSLDGKYLSGSQNPTSNSKIELDHSINTNGIYFISMLIDHHIYTIKLPSFK